MRVVKCILTLIFGILLSTTAFSQVTAVMEARVNIISGASLSVSSQPTVDLASLSSNDFEALNFSITAAPGTDMSISVNQQGALTNEAGAKIDLENLQFVNEASENGTRSVSVKGSLKEGQSLQGEYQGTFTAVVEYL